MWLSSTDPSSYTRIETLLWQKMGISFSPPHCRRQSGLLKSRFKSNHFNTRLVNKVLFHSEMLYLKEKTLPQSNLSLLIAVQKTIKHTVSTIFSMLHGKFTVEFALYSITSTRSSVKPRKACFNHILTSVVLLSLNLIIFFLHSHKPVTAIPKYLIGKST